MWKKNCIIGLIVSIISTFIFTYLSNDYGNVMFNGIITEATGIVVDKYYKNPWKRKYKYYI